MPVRSFDPALTSPARDFIMLYGSRLRKQPDELLWGIAGSYIVL